MLCQSIANQTENVVYCSKFKEEARKNSTDFTRNRKMSFEELVIFLLISLKCSTASALRRFFTDTDKAIFMTQQSLSEARSKVAVSAFVRLFNITVNTMTEHCTKKWHGYRIYAIDGSKISLPADKKLREHFGALGKDKTAPTAQGSILYDVLNDIVLDAAIEPLATDERTLAKKHIDACKNIAPDDKKINVVDRGYASFDLIETFENEGLFYLMRVKSKFNNDIDEQKEADGCVLLKQGEKSISVRVIKFMLNSGEEEVLITNVKDKRLGKNAFKKLYFMRWPIECKYDLVKNKLQLENFNTRTVEGIQQDFFAAMYLTNFAAAAAIDAQEEIEKVRKGKRKQVPI